MAKTPKDKDQLPPKEAAERRDAALRNMLKTPPKPHKDEKKDKR